ncbi:MAG: sigma-70 family RNA polymerase sigma factor [Myxococcales bacterium]|nr:sigma-70 family RNA polymerase sigma factor [Myxococcales bacterium]
MTTATFPAPAGSSDAAELGQLHAYFRDMSNHTIMSAADEIAVARTIVALRRSLWTAIFSYPPFIAPLTELVVSRADGAAQGDEVAALRATSRALRDRDTRANQLAFEAARAALVERMVVLDVDGPIADEVAAELDAVAADAPGERSLVVPCMPRQGSHPFELYVRQVRDALVALRAARSKFVEANLRLVVVIARRYSRGRMSLSDLIQEGNLGLMKAVGRFDPDMGCRFSTYGSWWIRHAITRALADKGRAIRVPVHLIEAAHRLGRARVELRRALGREPTVEEVAAHTGMSAAKVERVESARLDPMVSLDGPPGEHDGRHTIDLLADDDAPPPGDRLDAEVVQSHLREVLKNLRPLEADILRQRFGLADEQERTLREIADQYSLSRERIRQLQEQALGKIRTELRRRALV